jgi:hypothetical protein
LFKSCESNRRTEARGLKKRHEGKSDGETRIETRVRTRARMEVRIRMRVKTRIEAEWVPSIYLAVMNK